MNKTNTLSKTIIIIIIINRNIQKNIYMNNNLNYNRVYLDRMNMKRGAKSKER